MADAGRPGRRAIHELTLTAHKSGLSALHIDPEIPSPNGAGLGIEIVLGNHEAKSDVGMSTRSFCIDEGLLHTGLQIDDAVVFTVTAVDVLLRDQPSAAPIDLTLVERPF